MYLKYLIRDREFEHLYNTTTSRQRVKIYFKDIFLNILILFIRNLRFHVYFKMNKHLNFMKYKHDNNYNNVKIIFK